MTDDAPDADAAPDEDSGGGTVAAAPTARSPWGRRLRTLVEWCLVVVVALGLAFVVRAYVVQTFYIPSGSMEPTLHIGDRILVLKLAYRVTSPAIGDVVVFHAPYQERYDCGNPHVEDLVKRVMATPGDVIVSHGNRIYVNGKLLDQSWQHVVKLVTPIPRTKVGVNRYYMMGDNHPASCDSRVWGTLPRSNIIGKAVLIYWPLSRLSII